MAIYRKYFSRKKYMFFWILLSKFNKISQITKITLFYGEYKQDDKKDRQR
jgi:hypothetical protein